MPGARFRSEASGGSPPGGRRTDAAAGGARSVRTTFLLLVALSMLARLYPAVTAANLTPDVVEYLDQARHDARGEWGATSLKRHYLDDYPVAYRGSGHRPPLFPLVAGAVLAAGGSVAAVQTLNALIASLAVGVWYLTFAALFSRRAAAGAALAASFSPWFWGTSVFPLTEPLSMLLAGAAAWTVAAGHGRTARGAAALGALCALAFLTRRMDLVLCPVLLWLWASETARRGPGPERRRAAALCLPFLAAGAVVLAPFAAKNVRDFGAPFHDPNAAVLRGGEETFDHYRAPLPGTVCAYVRGRGATTVLAGVARGFRRNLEQITVGPGGLGLATLALPLAAWAFFRERQPAGVRFLAGLAAVNLAAYSLVGSHGYDDPRFMLLTTVPLCGLCLHAVDTWPGPPRFFRDARGAGPGPAAVRGGLVALLVAASLLQGAVLFALEIRKVPTVTIAGTPVRVLPGALLRYDPATYDRLLRELSRRRGAGDVTATGMPWLVHFFTFAPTALLPVNLDRETLPAYLEEYRVRIVVLDPESLGRERFLRYAELLRDLARTGRGEVWESGPFVFYRDR